ncbi:MAG: acyl-CoA dehydrogenase, partial [Clostridia bacterium]|nr:acyl-CoA dehydrogenase [Clostridia bacterium]
EGKGHQVAFNILNIGRFKLGAGCVGGGKRVIEFASEYALQRVQFKQPIAQFNIIKNKIANMAILVYLMESLVYRIGGMIEEKLAEVKAAGAAMSDIVQAIQEYAIECSISKVYCSEAMGYIADEGVQIFGGYGYGQEYPAERSYRDSRINRIFEGTNEVNRMLIPGTLLRKAMKNEVPFMESVMGLGATLGKLKEAEFPAESPAREEFYLNNMKTLFLLAAGNAAQKFGQDLTNEQEILCRLADMAMEVFAAESGLLRAKKMLAQGESENSIMAMKMTQCCINDMIPKMEAWAREVIAGTLEDEAASKAYSGLRLLTRFEPINTFIPKREIADAVYAYKKYFLDRT